MESQNYYEDMEMLSKMSDIKAIVDIFMENSFIDSPYHKEDLKRDAGIRLNSVTLNQLAEYNNMEGKKDIHYLENLELLGRIDEKNLLYVSTLLSNKDFVQRGYSGEDYFTGDESKIKVK